MIDLGLEKSLNSAKDLRRRKSAKAGTESSKNLQNNSNNVIKKFPMTIADHLQLPSHIMKSLSQTNLAKGNHLQEIKTLNKNEDIFN